MTTETAESTWRDAIEQLLIAANAIDQAHAMIRDLNLHNYIETGRGPYRQTLNSAFGIVIGLLRDLQEVICPECSNPMAENPACLAGNCPTLAEVTR